MPYYTDPNEKEQNQNGSAQISSASSGPVASGAPQQTQNQGQKLNTGSHFQNLDAYLKGNQSQQFGNQFLGNVQNTVNQAKQGQQQAAQAFGQQVQNANKLLTQDEIKKSLESPTQANPAEFQKALNQRYSGPNSLAESQALNNQYWSGTDRAQNEAKALGSTGGRFALLDQYFGRPQYSFGQKALDNSLYQHSGVANQANALQQQGADLRAQGIEQARNLQNQAAERRAQVDENRTQVQGAYNTAVSDAQKAVQDSLVQANQQRQAEQQAIQQALGSGQFNDAQLQRLGLSRGQQLFNTDLSRYVTVNNTPLTEQQAASPEQIAKINALAQLAGNKSPYEQAQSPASAAYDVNTAALLGDIANQKNAYGSSYDYLNNLLSGAQANYNSAIQRRDTYGSAKDLGDGIIQASGDPRQVQQYDLENNEAARQQAIIQDLQRQISALQSQYNVGRVL